MQNEYDVAIIGGGIQGCAVAQACAAAGFSTLLLEKNTWGSATSRSSSKLIHGGLRYLQTAQINLVRESLGEREWMLEHIPSLVKPNWFYIPIYKSSVIRPWKLFAGLSLYQVLCATSKHSSFKMVPKAEWSQLSGLDTNNLQVVFAYQDAQTDDQQLTQHVQQSAAKLGADCLENARLTRAAKLNGEFQICFKQGSEESCVKAKMIVNASGPWVNHTLACFTPAQNRLPIDLIQGTHIISEERISDRCFYLEAPSDKRAVFVLPWKDKTLIGTTETLFEGNPDDAKPLDKEIRYLLDTVKHYFPQQSLTVIDSFCGLRVLPKTTGSFFSRPRDVTIRVDGRMISLYGGKLTCWRAIAADVMKEIEGKLGERKKVDTRTIEI